MAVAQVVADDLLVHDLELSSVQLRGGLGADEVDVNVDAKAVVDLAAARQVVDVVLFGVAAAFEFAGAGASRPSPEIIRAERFV